jgi:outer membrane lipoprotein
MRPVLFPSTLAGLLLSTLLLSGCAKPPVQLAGTFSQISVTEAQGGGMTGQRVRWGGVIVSTTPGKEDTCFAILARPLNAKARPQRTDESEGRFIACAHGFYDPAIYSHGRDVTVVGTLQQPEMHKIGKHEYVYPKVAAETVYLWPHREYSPSYYYDPGWTDWYLYPGGGPWPYGYYSPLWGPSPYDEW